MLPLAFASAPTKFKMKNGSVSFIVPEHWENANGLFGVQLMLLGPMKSENRPVVTVESTDFAGMTFDSSSLKKNEKEYQEGRTEWLKKYNGKSLEFFNYQSTELASKITDHHIGFRYEIGNSEFVEHSHYITCGKNLYHLKTLLRANEESAHKPSLDKMINSFTCQ
jgi:hypothetical protein